jgi:pimeloyl-ACP methyl ester carboxylesterase
MFHASTTVTQRFTFILIHGAWQGAWAWETIVPRLKTLGHEVVAVDLPGNGHNPLPPAEVDLRRYAAHVVDIIDATEGPIVMIGHSMGGVAAAQACELRPEAIALAIFLAAFLLPDGMSVLQFYDCYLEPWMRGAHARVTYDETGLLSHIDPASAVDVFYHKADRALAEAAARRLTPQPEGGRRSQIKLSQERFGTVPKVYIEARDDRSVHLPLQRKMQELSPCLAVYGLDSDHAPQLSQPDQLVAVIMQAVADHARRV